MFTPRARVAVGAAFWAALAASAAVGFARIGADEKTRSGEALTDIVRLAWHGAPRRTVMFENAWPWLEPGDGIYRRDGFDLLRCGQVLRVEDTPTGRRLEVFFDPVVATTLGTGTRVTAFASGASVTWTYRALLPDHVRERIAAEWDGFLAANEQRITSVLIPLAKDMLRDLGPVLLAEAEAAVARHDSELRAIAHRYREEVLKPRILPLLKTEIWPLLVKHGEPPLRLLGRELWDALPILGLVWKGVTQQVDFSEDDKVSERFERYLESEALPILAARVPELEKALLEVLREASDDPDVNATLRESLATLFSDPELRTLLGVLVEEIARGEKIRTTIAARLSDPTAAKTIAEVRKELDGVFQRIGRRIVFADEETLDVHPDFARFLRTLVLKKDRRWILVEPAGTGAPGREVEPVDENSILAGSVADE